MANADVKNAERASFVPRFAGWAFGVVFLLAALGVMNKNAVTALWLFAAGLLLLPPSSRQIGRWMKRTVPRWLHVTTAVVGCLAIIGLGGPRGPTAAPVATNNPTPSQPIVPPAPVNEEDQLRQIVTGVLEGSNNMDKPYLRAVNVVQQVNGGWGVFTEFNPDDNLTQTLRKGGLESKMAEIYIALYTSGKDVQTASVAAYFPLVDKYGNESDGVVYKTVLNRKEADKVNWNADKATLRRTILPGVWSATLVHPEFH